MGQRRSSLDRVGGPETTKSLYRDGNRRTGLRRTLEGSRAECKGPTPHKMSVLPFLEIIHWETLDWVTEVKSLNRTQESCSSKTKIRNDS